MIGRRTFYCCSQIENDFIVAWTGFAPSLEHSVAQLDRKFWLCLGKSLEAIIQAKFGSF